MLGLRPPPADAYEEPKHPMTDETVDCFNCGRANPEWAQVCRSCGVPLRHGDARVVPTGRFPTDQASLISIAAVIGTIFLAVLAGLFISGLSPTEPSVGEPASPTSPPPIPSESTEATIEPTVAPSPPATPVPTPTATPALPATMAFGSSLNDDREVVEPVETFTPGVAFAYSVTMPDGFGADQIQNEIAKLGAGDAEEVIVLEKQGVGVNPDATVFGYVIGTAGDFLGQWGPGTFEWRVYVDDTLIARGTFNFTEG